MAPTGAIMDNVARAVRRRMLRDKILAPARSIHSVAASLVSSIRGWDDSVSEALDTKASPQCTTCREMVFQGSGRKPKRQKSKTMPWYMTMTACYKDRPLQSIEAAAANGCAMCKILLDDMRAKHGPTLPESTKVICYITWFPDKCRFKELTFTSSSWHWELKFDLLTGPDSTPSPEIPSSLSTLQVESMRQALTWLGACNRSHENCRKRIPNSNWLPTRLIDVGDEGRQPRLVITAEIGLMSQTPRYIALSHRWRNHKPPAPAPVTLTSKNINEFKQHLPMGTLSKTFQESIYLCRDFRVRYIWIDSLCIMQDSHEDWSRESVMMGEAYKSCICAFAASAASHEGSSDCLFAHAEPALVNPVRAVFQWKTHVAPYLCIRTGIWSDDVVDSPLNKRGWVLQERCLSLRTLHFGKQISWECRTLRACETYPGGKTWDAYTLDSHDATVKGKFDNAKTKSQQLNVWNSMVISYTKCELTKERDKLVAIAGLAKELQALSGDTYLAGLEKWLVVFHFMAWSCRDVCPKLPRPSTYCAPTWSWASVNGAVRFPILSDEQPLMHILDAEVQASSGDPFGEVTGGFIRVRGKIIPMETSLFYRMMEAQDMIEYFSSEINYHADDESKRVTSEAIWILPVRYAKDMSIFGRGYSWLLCLVLEGNGQWDYRPTDYSRVGLLEMQCLKPSPGNPGSNEQPNALAEIIFEKLLEQEEEIITII